MKRYRCHKEVEAGVIRRVFADASPGYQIDYDDGTGTSRTAFVTSEFFARGEAKAGDYLVRYLPDGYLSWSPKEAFESGYTEIVEAEGA